MKEFNEEQRKKIGQAIRHRRELGGMSQKFLAAILGVTYQAVQNWEAGKSLPRAGRLDALCQALATDSNTLLSVAEHPYIEIEEGGQSIGQFSVEEAAEAFSKTPYPRAMEFVEIPYYRDAKLAAGAGAQVYDEETDSTLTFQTAWLKSMGLKEEALCVVRCKGDSMEPRIHDGDVVLIDTARKEVEDSMVYAINYGGEAKLKRMIKKIDGSLVIRSDNQRYEDEVIPPNDDHASQLNVIGKAVWIGGML